MKYRKKPVVIDAWQVPAGLGARQMTAEDEAALLRLDNDLRAAGAEVDAWDWGPNGILIETLEGEMLARPGDWIIRGVNGEFYPCKPEIFAKTYEAVEMEAGG